jgi:glycyl-tRNA synthetase
MFLLVLSHSYDEEIITNKDGSTDTRAIMRIPPKIAPIKLAVLPLVKKDGLPEIAREIVNDCKPYFRCFYEEKDTIGKRYRRQDAIGTPFCVTVDHQTKEDGTVTLRNRDTMSQDRVHFTEIKDAVIKMIL